MTRRIAPFLAALVASVTLTACGGTTSTSPETSATAVAATESVASSLLSGTHAQVDDVEYDAADAVLVSLDGTSASGTGAGLEIDGSTVTITAAGTYVLSGTLTDGRVVVDSPGEGKVRLVLDGASISSSSGSAIDIEAADEAVLVLAASSSNALAAAGYGDVTTDTDAPNAALFSMADLTIGGTGSLTVEDAEYDGISTKDGLVVLGGEITVAAADDAVRGKDYLFVEDGVIVARAGGDGLHSDGTLTIAGGNVTVEESYEGLEASGMSLAGGTIDITASDDGINVVSAEETVESFADGAPATSVSGNDLDISGGTVTVSADGDGIDVNGAITMTGGTVVVSGPTLDMNGALDADGGIDVSGGTLLAAGSAGMAQAPDAGSSQGWVSVTFDDPVPAGTVVQLVDGDTVLASYTTAKETASLVFSSDAITSGEEYGVYVGGSPGGDEVAGYAAGGSISGATLAQSVTAGEHAGGFGPGSGGTPPGMP